MLTTHRDKVYLLSGISAVLIGSRFSPAINPYYFQIIIYIGINIILAESLNLINGFTGQFSLGHAGFMAVGAYTSSAITYYVGPHLSQVPSVIEPFFFLAALVAGGTAAAVVGLMVGVPSLRLKGDYLAIVTLGFGEIIRVVLQNLNFVGGTRVFWHPALYDVGLDVRVRRSHHLCRREPYALAVRQGVPCSAR